MRYQGSKKTSTRVAGHQDCGDCHPEPKGGRAYDERVALAMEQQEAECDACPNCVTPWKCNGPHLPEGGPSHGNE